MGVVYQIKAPDGRCYIGQTKSPLGTRISQHKHFALKTETGSPILSELIRCYGMEAFEVSILCECDDAELNANEVACIAREKTQYPDGLNIAKGGGVVAPHPESKRFMNEEGLPKYVMKRFLDGEHVGYRVDKHPNGPERRFISKDMLDNLERAIAYWNLLEALEEPLVIERVDRAKYVQHYQDGWCVKIPGQKAKYFESPVKTKDEKYKLAMEYVDRVKNGLLDPDAKHIRKIKGGYRVIYPDQKNKQFLAAKKTDEEKLELARDYLDRLRRGEIEEDDPECPRMRYICKHCKGFRVQHPDHSWMAFALVGKTKKENYDDAVAYLRSLGVTTDV